MNSRVAFLLFMLSLPGIFSVSWLALPLLIEPSTVQVPMSSLQIATAVQNVVLVFIAAFAGAFVSSKVGLYSPIISAIANEGRVVIAFRSQIFPGLVGGCIGAVIIIGFYSFAPESFSQVQPEKPLPIAVRMLYGGITEEVMVRWGLMSTIAWVIWRSFQRESHLPTKSITWAAIIISALIFGLSHLPSFGQPLSAALIAYITIGNMLFGLLAGFLFWRYGLESAIFAHLLSHFFVFLIHG